MSMETEFAVIHKQPVAWGDMDAFGHVNNVQYYRYMESARIHYLEQTGILNQGICIVIAHSQCQYFKPVVYPDQIQIGARVTEMRQTSLTMHYQLWSEQQQAIVAEGQAVLVCIDAKTGQKTPIPESARTAIETLEKQSF